MGQSSLERAGHPSRVGLRQRFGILVGTFLLLVLALTLTTNATLGTRDEAAQDIEDRVQPARDHLHALVVVMVPADIDQSAVDAEMAGLQRAVSGAPELEESLRGLDEAVAEWRVQEGDPQAALAAVDRMRAELLEVQLAASVDLEQAESRLNVLLWAVLGLAAWLVLAATWSLRRWLTVPLASIAKAADRVSEGDLHHPIPEVGSRELCELARDVERMRARIVGLFDASERAAEALDQQGVAIVSLRDELEPSSDELPPAVRFAAILEPAEGVLAGDWYDCVDLGDDKLALAVVDVSGHGPEAGIFALRAKHLLLPALDGERAPGEALEWLASHIGETGERFLSAFLAEVDTVSGRCRWASAGHPPGVIVHEHGVERLASTGPILGPLPGRWCTQETLLPPGAVLVAYTDGVIDAREGPRRFGYRRFFSLLERRAGEQPHDIVATCVEEIRQFARGRADDDMTVVAMSLAEMPSGRLVTTETPPSTEVA